VHVNILDVTDYSVKNFLKWQLFIWSYTEHQNENNGYRVTHCLKFCLKFEFCKCTRMPMCASNQLIVK